tara:strand:- start:174 stop:626 length:453 start_codon:yes stop_codon:yes gene_type:complete
MFYTMPPQTGFFSYNVSINPPQTTGNPFVFGFGCADCLPNDVITFLSGFVQTFTAENMVLFRGTSSGLMSFVGESGKLYDQDGNYFQSYQSGANFSISGNVFTGHHNYFYENTVSEQTLVNNNCERTTGTIDSFFILNVEKDNFYLAVAN